MEGARVFCFACGSRLEDRKGDRRLIVSPQNSPQNSYVFPLLHEVAAADTSADAKLDEVKLSAGYICRPCFRALKNSIN